MEYWASPVNRYHHSLEVVLVELGETTLPSTLRGAYVVYGRAARRALARHRFSPY